MSSRLLLAMIVLVSALPCRPALAQEANDAGPVTGAAPETAKPNFDDRSRKDEKTDEPRGANGLPSNKDELPSQPHRFGVPIGK